MGKSVGISLFSGIGGDTLGMKNAGINVVGFVEINPQAIQIHRENFPKCKLMGTNIEDIEYGGECFDELFSYWADQGEIPYGVMKARTGMPDEWIYDKLCELGFDKEFA